ncbi:hypothetical protein NW198_09240 [Thermophilibacter sp. ET337]|uniref:hypothetical protein n=1 Tax=Thermophilibacter sp. ET337 TaxID=2973084 RepID=UPI0021ABA6B4|nr:hypothetical protein [Thermophilibacter sp. ET337]MCR8908792.1 hypothetical protein [Thermophilibacter sp. ET337]
MAGNPYDFNRDGRWSTPERAFTHYGIHGELRRADEGRGSGPGGGGGSCLAGCAGSLVFLGALLLIFRALFSCSAG